MYLQTSRHRTHTYRQTLKHTPGPRTQGCVYQSRPCDHTWPRSRLAEANNTSHVQVSINRGFDGGYWEFQTRGRGAGGGQGRGERLGYLASQARGGGGGVWGSSGTGRREVEVLMERCFSRGRRLTALEPQRTLAAVRGSKYGRCEERVRMSVLRLHRPRQKGFGEIVGKCHNESPEGTWISRVPSVCTRLASGPRFC